MPESLWLYAVIEAIWKKNRALTRALDFKKTLFEVLYGIKLDLLNEHIWGSCVYVNTPSERRGNKLYDARGWLGYYAGTEAETIVLVWDPERKQVFRIASYRVDDGVGLDDDIHDAPAYEDWEHYPPANIPDSDLENDDDANASVNSVHLDEDPYPIASALLGYLVLNSRLTSQEENQDDDFSVNGSDNEDSHLQRQNGRTYLDNNENIAEGEDVVVRLHYFAAAFTRTAAATILLYFDAPDATLETGALDNGVDSDKVDLLLDDDEEVVS